MMTRRIFLAASAAATTATPAAATTPFLIPAEEARHERTFMQWPTSRKVYGSKSFLHDTQDTIANIANTIVDFEPVVMLADKSDHANLRAQTSEKIELWDTPTDELWCRDVGRALHKTAPPSASKTLTSTAGATAKPTDATVKSPPAWPSTWTSP